MKWWEKIAEGSVLKVSFERESSIFEEASEPEEPEEPELAFEGRVLSDASCCSSKRRSQATQFQPSTKDSHRRERALAGAEVPAHFLARCRLSGKTRAGLDDNRRLCTFQSSLDVALGQSILLEIQPSSAHFLTFLAYVVQAVEAGPLPAWILAARLLGILKVIVCGIRAGS